MQTFRQAREGVRMRENATRRGRVAVSSLRGVASQRALAACQDSRPVASATHSLVKRFAHPSLVAGCGGFYAAPEPLYFFASKIDNLVLPIPVGPTMAIIILHLK